MNSLKNSLHSFLNLLSYSYEDIKKIADYLLEGTAIRPRIGIICGSGHNALADNNKITDIKAFDYESIPNFPVSTVEGHPGRMVFGNLEGLGIMIMQGTFHNYEGYPVSTVAMPIRVMKLLGIKYLMITNAAGGINSKFKVGDIMIIHDHINLLGLMGNSPLRGPNDPHFGQRFPATSHAYSADLRIKAQKVANDMGIESDVHEGVLVCVGGPNYETVAELNALRTMGADAVGMSTVHEVLYGRHCGLTVFGFCLITNKCVIDYEGYQKPIRAQIIEVGNLRQKVCGDLLYGVIREIAIEESKHKFRLEV